MSSLIRSNYLAKEIAKNIKHFVYQWRWFQNIYQKQMALTDQTKKIFLEKVRAWSYLNPLIDMCFELWIRFKPVDIRSVLRSWWHLWDNNLSKRSNNIYYTYWIRCMIDHPKVKYYYTDLINYLFITDQLWEIMELQKRSIQSELLKSWVAIENWETKQKLPLDSWTGQEIIS